ncbi:MAG: pyruvate carboxylase [Chlamydiae bacterium]|nr:pyruvate carboxylase [Chlamydiota bacterium]
MHQKKFQKILVANRGEIAIRVFRAATELGARTVAIFSEEDRLSLHRYKADEAYPIGWGLGPLKAYLAIDEIIELAKQKKIDAIHPGYGFLSENAEFALACERSGITFIGPSSEHIAMMGNKVAARNAAQKIGLPVIPGTPDPVTLDEAIAFTHEIDFPVMLKSVFGGGGRGMRIARDREELKSFYIEAQREAKSAFGRPEIFIEKLVENPKHIEVQILADAYQNVVHCFERDCSIQRRHQKVIEIAPAGSLLNGLKNGEELRQKILKAAVDLAKSTGYQNAGTVEFLVQPELGKFYFMEMNTRIQVEHTVTEMITGMDLVKAQIRIAEGYQLSDPEIGILNQSDIQYRGAAIQCRITTEDPAANFVPDYGRLTTYRSPAGHGVRLDAGSAHTGAIITPFYDSLLVKVTTYGRHLKEAAERMDRTLAEFRIRGVKTNINFLRAVMKEKEFLEGHFKTDYLERHPELKVPSETQDRASKLLQYIGNIIVCGAPHTKIIQRPKQMPTPRIPKYDGTSPVPSGTKQILDEKGPEGLIEWIGKQKHLLITDTTFRDAHQSLLATRVRTFDMLGVAQGMCRREPHLFSYEMWGGATFDTSLRFLKEDPWARLAAIRQAMPNALLQMLLRGSNAVGYTSYPSAIIKKFVQLAADTGIDIFRIFDAFNQLKGIQVAIEAVRNVGRIAEPAICYTGNIEDPTRTKYSLQYYVKLAKEFEKAGAHILGIKDMAGLLRPYSARVLVKVLKEEVGIPIHLHTHDTTGVQAATILMAAEEGVNIADAALASMSGIMSQVNLNSLVAALEHHKRSTGLHLSTLNEYSAYWEEVRKNYIPFESHLRSSSAEVYFHEMPGGQYTNLYEQAEAMGLSPRWNEVINAYALANKLFGDMIKVTPSSKVVGDMALFMVANNLDGNSFFEKAEHLSFPASVINMLKGDLGFPPGGFPKRLQKVVLKDQVKEKSKPLISLAESRVELEKKLAASSKKTSFKVSEQDVISYVMYPQGTVDYLIHKKMYGDTSILPTSTFFFGMQPGEEIAVDLEEGKTLYIKLIAISDTDVEGMKTIFFELNGDPRDVKVRDPGREVTVPKRPKADPENLHHVGSPIPGRVTDVFVKTGDAIQKGDKLFMLEAMKMETSISASRSGTLSTIYVKSGDVVDAGDLVMAYQ